mgnify:CR=1 FL=1
MNLLSNQAKPPTIPKPTHAPANTSVGQCAPKATRERATTAARAIHHPVKRGHRRLNAVASANTRVAWPEGKERPSSIGSVPKEEKTSNGRGRLKSPFRPTVSHAAHAIPTHGLKRSRWALLNCPSIASSAPKKATLNTNRLSPKCVRTPRTESQGGSWRAP